MSLTTRRTRADPSLETKLAHMRLPLSPLVQLTTGAVHPCFPRTLLGFWLLTDAELESLAAFYHQRTPSAWTAQYPCPVAWDSAADLEQKRRRIGRFIGLRGCESPSSLISYDRNNNGDALRDLLRPRSEEQIAEEARRARMAEEEEIRRKARWY